MSDLTIALSPSTSPRSAEERAGMMQDPGFGQVFTDHMVTARYSRDRGWYDASLSAYQPLTLDPATSVLHYGQAIFEGLKAYHQPDGSVAVFRPEQNARRFQRSARRMAMAEVPEPLFLDAVSELVKADREWVPTEPGEALYLRPLEIAMDPFLGVRPAENYLFLLFASPAGAYFTGGVRPVTVWLSTEYTRAAPGGTGEAKCAGNYAASLVAQAQAAEQGCDQVVWLDAIEHKYVEEMGGMNLYFVFADGRLVTPALTGTLLPGVTRDSILALGGDMGLDVEERLISTEEWEAGCADGAISEVFACGTAAVVTPVGSVKHAGGAFDVADGQPGAVTMKVRETLLGIQHGTAPDPHGWMHTIA
ncbi:MAG TPA: branched-chain amino acid aminotransferase [Actinomycetes bacterium]|jgi:branched-chain amino acid aminotransferase|nr:branched-chain amino acid aminotransferase [Actinomycetes bacterium]